MTTEKQDEKKEQQYFTCSLKKLQKKRIIWLIYPLLIP